jgi:hypothetical protein
MAEDQDVLLDAGLRDAGRDGVQVAGREVEPPDQDQAGRPGMGRAEPDIGFH